MKIERQSQKPVQAREEVAEFRVSKTMKSGTRQGKSGTKHRNNQPKQKSLLPSAARQQQVCEAEFPSKFQIYLAQPKVGIFDTFVNTTTSPEIICDNSSGGEPEKQVNVTFHVTGSSKFVRKVIDKTRNCIKQAINKTPAGAARQKSSVVTSPRESAHQQQAQLDQKMHSEMRDRVFENHQKSAQLATESAKKAQSMNELLTETLAKNRQLLSDYKQTEDSLQSSTRLRLDQLLAAKGLSHHSTESQESIEVKKKEEVQPGYLSWRPQRYDNTGAKPPRRVISAFSSRAYSTQSAAAAATWATDSSNNDQNAAASISRQAKSRGLLKSTGLTSDFTKTMDERQNRKISQLSCYSTAGYSTAGSSSCNRSRQGSTLRNKKLSETNTTLSRGSGRKQQANGQQYLELPNVAATTNYKSGSGGGKKWAF